MTREHLQHAGAALIAFGICGLIGFGPFDPGSPTAVSPSGDPLVDAFFADADDPSGRGSLAVVHDLAWLLLIVGAAAMLVATDYAASLLSRRRSQAAERDALPTPASRNGEPGAPGPSGGARDDEKDQPETRTRYASSTSRPLARRSRLR